MFVFNSSTLHATEKTPTKTVMLNDQFSPVSQGPTVLEAGMGLLFGVLFLTLTEFCQEMKQ